MLRLPQVTLISLTGKDIEAHQKALDYSSKEIEFAEVRLVEVPIKTIDEWNKLVIYDLWKFVDTKFALLVHADGFVVNPEKWNPDWLNYDYIGSPWPLPTDDYSYRTSSGEVIRVGNSVSLRSKKLMKLPTKLNLEWKPYYGNTNEDGYICVHEREILEYNGCKFAPFEAALHFGRETNLPENQDIDPFVFHRYDGKNANYPRFAPVRNEVIKI